MKHLLIKSRAMMDSRIELKRHFKSFLETRGKADPSVSEREARRRLVDLHDAVNHSLVDADERATVTPVVELFGAITQARRSGEALDTSLATAASLALGIKEAKTAPEAEDLRYRLWHLLANQQQRFKSVEEVHEWRDEFMRVRAVQTVLNTERGEFLDTQFEVIIDSLTAIWTRRIHGRRCRSG